MRAHTESYVCSCATASALGEVLKAWRRLPFRVPAPVAANVSHQRTAFPGVATGYPRSRLSDQQSKTRPPPGAQ